jgi:hypothetical protein
MAGTVGSVLRTASNTDARNMPVHDNLELFDPYHKPETVADRNSRTTLRPWEIDKYW